MTDPTLAWHFHHIGIACQAIAFETKIYRDMGYEQEGADFTDPAQGVSGRFLTGPGPRLELLQPLPGSETLKPFLSAGIKMYHQAFETADLDGSVETMRARRSKVVSPPKPAVAFGGRKVVFLALPNTTIIELIQAADSDV